MQNAVTVVISAAGMGTRLGMSIPKALVEVDGTPILARQLEALHDVDDVVVVAGFRSRLVIELLRDVRPTTRVALNHDFASTGTAASVAKGSALAEHWILSLDGDLLVAPDDLWRALEHPGPCLGIVPVRSKVPVYAELEGDVVVGLSQDRPGPWEWSGLVKVAREIAVRLGTGHVFAGLTEALPMPSITIDCVEVDDLDDLEHAEEWIRRRNGGRPVHGR